LEDALLGEGILKGLKETARNFVGSFVSEERLTTVEYPEERLPLPEASRNFPFLVYDGTDWEAGLRCVACQICEKECPPKCIYIEKSKDKKPDAIGKPQFYPAKFDIDISVCMSCQICVEVCPFEAIKMDTQFELSTDNRFGGLLFDRKELARSNEYYHEIHPTEASEVDARLAQEKAAAEAKAKATAAAAAAKAAAPAAKPAAAPAATPASATATANQAAPAVAGSADGPTPVVKPAAPGLAATPAPPAPTSAVHDPNPAAPAAAAPKPGSVSGDSTPTPAATAPPAEKNAAPNRDVPDANAPRSPKEPKEGDAS
jgi:NADH-quinone oxidoreductase subunit I